MSKQEIYNRLRQGGLSQCGALAMMGNWQCESGLEPNRLQGDFSPYRTLSKDYVRRVESFQLQRDQFAHDGKGYGLYQLTYWSRKAGYWDAWHKSGLPFDSIELQCKYAIYELQNDYSALLSYLCQTNDLYEATARICREFERPAVNNIDARFQAANSLKYEIDLDNWETDEVATDLQPNLQPVAKYWPPRMLCDGMEGPDVEVLQAILKARGYIVTNPDGIFGSYLEQKVEEFQEVHGLVKDGICGPMTWGELLKR